MDFDRQNRKDRINLILAVNRYKLLHEILKILQVENTQIMKNEELML